MNVNHHQTKRDRSYFEWGDNMQITCKGKGEIAMTENELVDFFSVTWRKLNYRLQLLLKVSPLQPDERDTGEQEVYVNGRLRGYCLALSAYYHHRFVLSIGQHGSPLLQETCMSEIAEAYIHNNTDILNRKDGYLMIIFSFSFIDYILLHNYNKV